MRLNPLTPYEVERLERERIARKKPHLALATYEPKPTAPPVRDPFAWIDIADIAPVEGEAR